MIETFPTEENTENRLKRARMRAWRRGMREMDLILGGYVDLHGPSLDGTRLDALEKLLTRRDQDLYAWISGSSDPVPSDATDCEVSLISDIRENWRPDTKN